MRKTLNRSTNYLILLTARNTSADIIGGLASGADDYITKPFQPEESGLVFIWDKEFFSYRPHRNKSGHSQTSSTVRSFCRRRPYPSLPSYGTAERKRRTCENPGIHR